MPSLVPLPCHGGKVCVSMIVKALYWQRLLLLVDLTWSGRFQVRDQMEVSTSGPPSCGLVECQGHHPVKSYHVTETATSVITTDPTSQET